MAEIYEGPSRFTGSLATANHPETAVIELPETGVPVRGLVVQRHEMGQVTIEWAGMRITGFPRVNPEMPPPPEI